ncbi:hypothetical protein K2173_007561 [Erythroxylum novogranatense]|uniref:Carboxypeptidase n=1 Tax=Erythroxylum novogranatense TaxID=1862640 RepID=A0AAV8T6I9_9ROSI|nr:hypothetical protein K2173_007561 [Erythroxylum novogranatense]
MEAKLLKLLFLALSSYLLVLSDSCNASQTNYLQEFIRSRKFNSSSPHSNRPWNLNARYNFSSVYIGSQEGTMEADKITELPGQPEGVNFDQYAGYITVDPKNGRALFYYFAESPQDSETKALVLWLSGGPGCSSLGLGAMEELGPFRVNGNGKTLFTNPYAWNNAANILFLESPAGVGFSYSNSSSDYSTGDEKTAEDAFTFLVNWLERFPQYKARDFYITRESYAGHYVPELAVTIISMNNIANQTIVNLKGIAIGNALIDVATSFTGALDFLWSHALLSDETYSGIKKNCDIKFFNFTRTCQRYLNQSYYQSGNIDPYNIYAPLCNNPSTSKYFPTKDFDPCSVNYVHSYLNLAEVQTAIHAKSTKWEVCGGLKNWTDAPNIMLPVLKYLMQSGIRLWIYSGDIDSVIPVTATRFGIHALKLPIVSAWRPWCTSNEVGGYVEGYEGLIFTTIRGAGHTVPSYQPERALTLISAFLHGKLPPTC